MHPQVAAAKAIATIAHKGQTDKNGADYISHPSSVADRLSEPAQVAAAWLHDVIEDCSEVFAGTPPLASPPTTCSGLASKPRWLTPSSS